MCGRYTIIAKAVEVEKRFNVTVPSDFTPRYNAAPTQILPVITNESQDGLSFFQWGLIPSWARDKSIGPKLINARSETLQEKSSFKEALKYRRCLVPADGYYEWKKSSKKTRIPYRIHLATKKLFSFAGLWEEFLDEDEKLIHSFTIITTQGLSNISHIHERMPLILEPEHEQLWLNNASTEDHLKILKPSNKKEIAYYPVSNLVNSVSKDNPELILPSPTMDQRGNLTLFD